MIFLDFLKVKKFKYAPKAPNCTINFFFRGSMPLNPLADAWHSPPPKKKVAPPWQILHTPMNYSTTEKFI